MRATEAREGDPRLRIRLFGELDLRLGGDRLPALTSSRARSLLGYLVVHAGVARARQRLAFLLWPDSTEAQARTNLRNVLHLLRRAAPPIEQFLEVTPTTLCWAASPSCWVDVAAFSAALDEAAAADAGSDRAVAALRTAVDLYGGDLLADCYDEWLVEERARLRDRYVSALRQLTEILVRRSEHAEAVRAARQLTRCEPLNEEHHQLLIQVHDAAGDRAAAMRAYHECAAVLHHELDLEPSAATRRAYARAMRDQDAGTELDGREGTARRTALIGRETERARLLSSWREAEEGRAQLVLVTGEPGVGKTRLVEELASWCAHRGAVVGRARSYPTEGELGYGVVISWLRSPDVVGQLRRAPAPDIVEMARLLPELGLTGSGGSAAADEAEQRLRLFEAVARALTGSGRAVLLVADDAHWSDAASLQLVHYLVRRTPESRLLVVATARGAELADQSPLTALVSGLRVLDAAAEVALDRLSRSGTAELARRLLGRGLDEAAADALYAETEGNPLFVVETIRAGWDGRRGPTALSPKLQAVIDGRLRQLSPPALHLLGVGATVGRAFTAELVGSAAGLDDLALVRGLDELWRRGMIREHDGDAYDFSHGKIREAAYDDLSPAVRRRNHLLVAEALLRLNGRDTDAVSGQLATNYDRAGRTAEAVEWYLRAAVQALRLNASAEAVAILERAWALVARLPPEGKAERELEVLSMLPTALGGVEGFASDRLAGVQQRAVELARLLGTQLEPPLLRSLVMSGLCRDEFAEARAAADRLLTSARSAGDEGLATESEYLLGIAAFWAADFEAARGNFERVVERFRTEERSAHLLRFGHDPKVVCLSRLANTLWFLGHPEEAGAARDAAISLASEVGHPYSSDVALVFAAMLAVDLDEHDRFVEFVAAFADGRARSRVFDINASAFQGFAEVLEGQASRGITRIRGAIDASPARNPAPGFRSTLLRLLVAAHDISGDAAAGLAAADEALRVGGTPLWQPEMRRLRARFLGELGHPLSDVDDELRRAAAVARLQGARGPERRIRSSRSRLHTPD